MPTDESVMLKYNISIIKSDWLAVVCISSVSSSQHMLLMVVLDRSGVEDKNTFACNECNLKSWWSTKAQSTRERGFTPVMFVTGL